MAVSLWFFCSAATFAQEPFNLAAQVANLKLNLFEELLVGRDLLFKPDDNGLRDKITPLVGLGHGL